MVGQYAGQYDLARVTTLCNPINSVMAPCRVGETSLEKYCGCEGKLLMWVRIGNWVVGLVKHSNKACKGGHRHRQHLKVVHSFES